MPTDYIMIIHPHIPKRKKRKPTAKQRSLQASWEDILKKYETKTTTRKVAKSATLCAAPYRRETKQYPILNTHTGCCTKSDSVKYTGTAMMGIATLHKSVMQPVFDEQYAKDVARMRRG